jgi:heptosyltransferase-3
MPSPLPDPVDAGLVRGVLVIKLRHHGDVLLTSPVFTTLRSALPDAQIDALVYRETAPMLQGHPAISQIHTIDRAWKRQGPAAQLRAESGLLGALRRRRFDLVVHLTEHRRGAWLTRLLRPRYSVAREFDRAHWLWRTSFTHYYRLPRATPRHTVECNLDSLRRIGLQPLPEQRALVLVPGDEAAARVLQLLDTHGVAPRKFIQIHPGSRWMFKCWTAGNYAALIDRLAKDGWQLVITGADDDRERDLTDEILAALANESRARTIDLGGKLNLRELAALTAQARAFIGVDSAPMHIAAAMQTPVVALFGPSGDVEWGPWRVPNRTIVSTDHPCRPCGNDGCGGGKISECLTTLPVDRVYGAVIGLLSDTRAGS